MARKKTAKKTPPRPNKAIPTLPRNTDFFSLFGDDKENKSPNFAEILDRDFDENEITSALYEKKRPGSEVDHNIGAEIKKYPPPQSTLDLHGFTAKEAELETEHFVRAAAKSGMQTVLIITGKGLHSQGECVLRDVVEMKIAELKKKSVILTFKWEKKHKNKSGALFVYIS